MKKMEVYKNLSRKSGISHYEIGDDYIDVKFIKETFVYTYSISMIKKHHIDKMKILAIKGEGLCTYINQNPEVNKNFCH